MPARGAAGGAAPGAARAPPAPGAGGPGAPPPAGSTQARTANAPAAAAPAVADTAAPTAAPAAAAPSTAVSAAPPPAVRADTAIDEAAFSKAYASPSVRKFARELGADLGRIKGTGVARRIPPAE